MKLFTQIMAEAKKEYTIIGPEDLKRFFDVVRKSRNVSKEYLTILQDCIELGLVNGQDIDEKVINGSSNDLKWMAMNHGGSLSMYVEINKLAKKIKSELRGLPWFMNKNDFNDVLNGTKDIDDIVLDLETDKGREAVAKQYAPLVAAIAAKYRGSGLDYDALVSAGMMGLTKAMNDYHKPDEIVDVEQGLDNEGKKQVKKNKGQSFKQYAGWRIRFQILNDLNDLSRTVKIGQYQYEKNKSEGDTKGNFNVVSIDTSIDDEGNTMVDRMEELATDNQAFKDRETDKKWAQVYKLIDDRFSARTAGIFYKNFGLHGYKKMKQVEIAKELHITGAAVNMSVKDVLKYLKSNKKTMMLLQDLLSMYTESLIATNTASTIADAMIQDDIFIMLEEITKWTCPMVFNNTVGRALDTLNEESRGHIIDCLENDINFIDEHYDDYRKDIVFFLETIYPTECIRRKSDVEVISLLNELNENHHLHNMVED